jgi:ubiquinol oxidase
MHEKEELERLVIELNDDDTRRAYKEPLDSYRASLIPRVLGSLVVFFGNVVYGKKPSYLKFRAIEVIARVPYHSWVSAAYTLLTLFYSDERKAVALGTVSKFARLSQDNETMHVVVISRLACLERRPNIVVHTVIPMLFAFVYFWASYILYLVSKRYSLELNYCFERHAYEQYDEFLRTNEASLKEKAVESEFLAWYGRHPRNQYEFFESVRNDELVHRNMSIHEIQAH